MADKRNSQRDPDERAIVGDDELRGIASEEDDEFEDSEDVDEEDEDEESTTF
jgi:hypothetical protein